MQAASTDHLFQTDAELAKAAARAAKADRIAALGRPIKLSSKPLDLAVRCNEKGRQAEAWTAESGGVAKRISLESGKTIQVYKGHDGPVTSLAFAKLSQLPFELLITASWDKSIRLWNIQTGCAWSIQHNAHTDFVKCLLVIDKLGILISGGSDKDIRIWDLRSLRTPSSDTAHGPKNDPAVGEVGFIPTFAASLRGSHTRPIEVLSAYEIVRRSNDDIDNPLDTGNFVLWSADSMGRVCIWEIWRNNRDQLEHRFKHTWLAHQTTIYDILFLSGGIAWTASGDKSVTMWQFDDTSSDSPTKQMWLSHPDYVKAVLWVNAPTMSGAAEFLVTACTDEAVRVWDTSSLGSGGSLHTPLAVIEGHAHEVNRLKLAQGRDTHGNLDSLLISTSLDGTLRQWSILDVLSCTPETAGKQIVSTTPNEAEQKAESNRKSVIMTAEEEAELAELLDN